MPSCSAAALRFPEVAASARSMVRFSRSSSEREPVIEVVAKPSVAHHRAEIAVGRGDPPDVDLDGLGAAEALERAIATRLGRRHRRARPRRRSTARIALAAVRAVRHDPRAWDGPRPADRQANRRAARWYLDRRDARRRRRDVHAGITPGRHRSMKLAEAGSVVSWWWTTTRGGAHLCRFGCIGGTLLQDSGRVNFTARGATKRALEGAAFAPALRERQPAAGRGVGAAGLRCAGIERGTRSPQRSSSSDGVLLAPSPRT